MLAIDSLTLSMLIVPRENTVKEVIRNRQILKKVLQKAMKGRPRI